MSNKLWPLHNIWPNSRKAFQTILDKQILLHLFTSAFFFFFLLTVLSLKSVIFILLQSTTITKSFKVTKLFAFLPKVVNNFNLCLGIEKINKSATFNKNSTSECISFVTWSRYTKQETLLKVEWYPIELIFFFSI